MTGRDDLIYQEAAALWQVVFGEPPPAQADGVAILEMITDRLPPTEYDRITSPHLRPTAICFPKHNS